MSTQKLSDISGDVRGGTLETLRSMVEACGHRKGPVFLCDDLVHDLHYTDMSFIILSAMISTYFGLDVTDADVEMWKKVKHVLAFVKNNVSPTTI